MRRAVVGAMVLLYRVCVYWFVVLVGGVSLATTATGFRAMATDALDDPDVAEHLES